MIAIKEYHRPERIEEALTLLSRKNPKSAILAGGTHLLSTEITDIEAVIDLQALGLDKITVNDSTVEIGSMARLQDIIEHPDIPEFLVKMALREGPNTFRNAGTIGGAVVVSNPNSELYAALLIYNATLTVRNDLGLRRIPLADFSEDVESGGIITAVTVDRFGSGAIERVARTPADEPIVAVIGRKTKSGAIKLAFCGIRNRPFLANVEEIANMNAFDDFRGSSDYRKEMALVLAQRVEEKIANGKDTQSWKDR